MADEEIAPEELEGVEEYEGEGAAEIDDDVRACQRFFLATADCLLCVLCART